MRVMVTKKMVNELNKRAKDRPYKFDYRTTDTFTYKRLINIDYWTAYDYGDYDYDKGFKYIAVIYDGELYAMPQYITTYDLHRLFVKGDTIDTYCKRVVDAYEV